MEFVMKKYKICVYAICKNEEQFVDRWINFMSEADLIVVTDTVSTDNTVKKLRQAGALVYIHKVKPWRFDTARNIYNRRSSKNKIKIILLYQYGLLLG